MGGFQQLSELSGRVPVHVRIEKAVAQPKAKGVENDHCPRCDVFDWSVDILDIPVNSAMSSLYLSTSPLPFEPPQPTPKTTGIFSVLSLVCKNCGYSIFHNLSMLDK